MATNANADLIKLVHESGLLNPSATLEDVLKLNSAVQSQQTSAAVSLAPGLPGGVTALKQALVHNHFFLVYNDEA